MAARIRRALVPAQRPRAHSPFVRFLSHGSHDRSAEGELETLCRRALVLIARRDGGAGKADATPEKFFVIGRGLELAVESERALGKPVSVLLVDPAWNPCLGKAPRGATPRWSRENQEGRIDVMVVEGCPAHPNRYAVTAVEGVSGADVRSIVADDDLNARIDSS